MLVEPGYSVEGHPGTGDFHSTPVGLAGRARLADLGGLAGGLVDRVGRPDEAHAIGHTVPEDVVAVEAEDCRTDCSSSFHMHQIGCSNYTRSLGTLNKVS